MDTLPKKVVSYEYLRNNCFCVEKIWFLDLPGRIVERCLHRKIKDEDVSMIIQFLRSDPKIKHVDLSFNNITSIGLSDLANFLAEINHLISLNLMYNDIQIIEYSVAILSKKWSLKSLILNGNKFGASDSIAGIIHLNESLIELDIGNTDQTMRTSIDILANFLPQNWSAKPSIKIIDLSRILPYNKILETIYMTHVIRCLEKVILCHNFVRINLSKNSITDYDVEILLDALSRCTELEALDFSCNVLTSHGMELLSKILPFTNIKDLNISSNRIADSGSGALGAVWSKTKIQYLDISNNRIQDNGMINLLQGVKYRSAPVETLFIYGNPISDKTAIILYRIVYDGIISSFATDIIFDWDNNGNLLFFEDISIKKHIHLSGMVRDLSTIKRQKNEICCKNTEKDKRITFKNEKIKKQLTMLLLKLKYYDSSKISESDFQ